MSYTDFLYVSRDLAWVENALKERLARIEAEPKTADERMAVLKREEAEDADIEDDFAGGSSRNDMDINMHWRSHLAEFIFTLREIGDDSDADALKLLADVGSLEKPFTEDDEAETIEAILECLPEIKKHLEDKKQKP